MSIQSLINHTSMIDTVCVELTIVHVDMHIVQYMVS